MTDLIRIATRASPLALWQAEEVKRLLLKEHKGLAVELVPMVTRGDKILDRALNKVGGKGLFIKELEHSLYENTSDIAVHSMKDVPMELPEGLSLPVTLERADPRDAFVSNNFTSLNDLPANARVGTSSLRRQALLASKFPGFTILDLRGNVGTRLSKLDNNEYDAIILAAAGLQRLEMPERIASFIEAEQSLPAIGQGAVAIECRSNDQGIIKLIEPLNHQDTYIRVQAERQLNLRMHGGCHVPIAGHAVIDGETLTLDGFIGLPDGSKSLSSRHIGHISDPISLGNVVADDLLSQGAQALLDAIDA